MIKLFLRSGNLRRVLFLVDRLEVEDQAKKAFAAMLSADFQTVIYKENRDDWRRAEIVDSRQFTDLATNPYFTTHDFRAVLQPYRTLVPEYVKDYVSSSQFAP